MSDGLRLYANVCAAHVSCVFRVGSVYKTEREREQ